VVAEITLPAIILAMVLRLIPALVTEVKGVMVLVSTALGTTVPHRLLMVNTGDLLHLAGGHHRRNGVNRSTGHPHHGVPRAGMVPEVGIKGEGTSGLLFSF